MLAEGVPSDTLGLFVGEAFAEEGNTTHPLPAQVILFTDNLWDEAEGQLHRFRDEIRITLLHELGHYLGLDEPDLDERGLG
jgi:predicted Zn-dependent protease with MMP-like domain